MNILAVDDEYYALELLRRTIEEIAKGANTYQCRDVKSAINIATKVQIDVAFLDIHMPEMNGIELARRVRETDERVQMVFITGYPDFIAEGYEVSALHYLMKPVSREKLARVLDRAAQSLSRQGRTVLLPVGKETLCLPADEIRYAESLGHYMIVYTDSGNYKCRMTAGEAETLLGQGFARCHRSVIVGLRHVARVTKTAVFLTDGTELPLGKGLYDEINRTLISTLREM